MIRKCYQSFFRRHSRVLCRFGSSYSLLYFKRPCIIITSCISSNNCNIYDQYVASTYIRTYSSTSYNRPSSRQVAEAVARNKQISQLGRQRKWKEMLKLFREEKNQFSNVNYATMMSQLGRSNRDVDRMDPLLGYFIDDLAHYLQSRGLKSMGVREVSNIVHAISKMDLRSPSSMQILEQVVDREDSIAWLINQGSSRDISNIVYACAKLNIKPLKLFHEIEENIEVLLEDGNRRARAVQVGNTAWSFAKLGFVSSKLFAEIEKRADWLVKSGDPQAISNIAWASSKLDIKIPHFFAQIEKNPSYLLKEGKRNNPEVATITAWAFATSNVAAPNLFNEIQQRAEWLVSEGNPQAVANAAWSFASLGFKSPRLFTEIERQGKSLVENGTPQSVANTAWAFARLDIKAPNLFTEIDAQAEWLVEEGSPQCIANIAWASATLGIKSPNLFAEIEKRSNLLVREGKPQEIANTTRAFATLGIDKSSKLFANIEQRAKWLVAKGTPQEVTNIAWAAATLNFKAPNFFNEIEKQAGWLVKEGNRQSVVNAAWAFAKLGIRAPKLFHEIETNSKLLVETASPRNVSSILWSASKLRYFAPMLLNEADVHSKRLLGKGSSQFIANTSLAFALAGYNASIFFTSLEEVFEESLLKTGNAQEICNTCYSLVILNLARKYNKMLFRLWGACMEMDFKIFTVEALVQLTQIEAFSAAEGINLPEPTPALRQRMNNAMTDNYNSPQSPPPRYQKQLSLLLQEIGFAHEEEVSPIVNDCSTKTVLGGRDAVCGGLLSIDFACQDRKIAIEYDGEYHFLRNLPKGDISKREDGSTKAKRRFLEKIGWKVINLDYRDYILASSKSREEKIQWLKKELDAVNIEGLYNNDDQGTNHVRYEGTPKKRNGGKVFRR